MSGSKRSRDYDRDHEGDSSHRRSSSKKHSRRDRDSRSDDEDPLVKQARSMIKEISKDDYFIKAAEFRVWLHEKKNKYLDELKSEDARYYFGKFVKAWNRFELDPKYYDGINSSQLSSHDSTRYKWSFAKRVDQHELDSIRDHVDTMTNSQKHNRVDGRSGEQSSDSRRVRRNVGPSLPKNGRGSDDEDEWDRRDRERSERKRERKEKRTRDELVLDEIAPKETGREAQLAKKRAQNAYHKRERSPDVELNESDLYGDDRSSLEQLKRIEQARTDRRAEQQRQKMAPIREKLDSYRAKEDQTLAMFRQMAEEQRKRGGL